jgi:hypothetical protein
MIGWHDTMAATDGRAISRESANRDAFPIGFGGWYIAADPPAKHVLAAFARG